MEQNPRWQDLSQQYAMCVRDFSDVVARLGGHRDVGPKTVALWQQIKELHAACLPLEKAIDQHLGLEERQMGTDGN